MNKMSLLIGAFVLLSASNAAAQSLALTSAQPDGVSAGSNDATSPEAFAKLRAAAYAEALGLGEAETQKLTSVFLEGENQVAKLRQQCMSIQTEVEGTMGKYDGVAEQALTPEQQAKLAEMKKEGTWHPATASCAPAAAKAGCAGHAPEGKAGGCCAGKAGAHGTAKPTAAPTK